MKSAYPSSQSFFDATSDWIRAEDVDKCRSRSSFSSLADLFSNPTCKSDLFPNVRTPVSVAEAVLFPAKKKRECEEKTSIWHEWGSGECQTENVAQESSGLVSDPFRPSASDSSVVCTPTSRANSFPNLGSANISLVPAEFAFPIRKNREEGSSWREERTSWQDWSMSGSASQSAPTDGSSPVGSFSRHCNLLTSVKPDPISNLGASISSSEELCFPARKKREERSFWQDWSLDGNPLVVEAIASPRETTSGVSSLADMYLRKPGSKFSSLFSEGIVNATEEVIFPKRKDRVDRNAWRDWTNTGYCDWDDETDLKACNGGNRVQSSFNVDAESNVLGCREVAPSSYSTGLSTNEESSRNLGIYSTTDRLSHNSFRSSAYMSRSAGIETDLETTSTEAIVSTVQLRAPDMVCSLRGGLWDNAAQWLLPDSSLESIRDEQIDFTRISCFPPSKVLERTMDGGESSSDGSGGIRYKANDDFLATPRLRSSRGDHRNSRRTGKYPPPLGYLARQGSSRVPQHMPWVQLQPIRSEGRFMLQEVKVTQPVVFQPIRKEGRLVLHLIGQECGDHDEGETRFQGLIEPIFQMSCPAPVHVVNEGSRGKVSAETDLRLLSEYSPYAVKERPMQLPEVWPETRLLRIVELLESILLRTFDVLESREAGVEAADGDGKCGDLLSPFDRGYYKKWGFAVVLEKGIVQDRMPSWILNRSTIQGRKFGPRSWLQSEVGFREIFASSSLEAERLCQRRNISPFHTQRENGDLRGQLPGLSRTQSLPNGPSGPPGVRAKDQYRLSPSRSTRYPPHHDSLTSEIDGEARLSTDGVSVRGDGAFDTKSSCAVGQAVSLTTAHSFLLSLTMKSDLPGEIDSRLPNFTPSAAFSCAEGLGKRHHEKSFWEQQPCVS